MPSPHIDTSPGDAAIIGMACRFPGAPGAAQFATLLRHGVVAVPTWKAERQADGGIPRRVREHTDFGPVAGVLGGADLFDKAYFGIAPADAVTMDPQHRIFLMEAAGALDD